MSLFINPFTEVLAGYMLARVQLTPQGKESLDAAIAWVRDNAPKLKVAIEARLEQLQNSGTEIKVPSEKVPTPEQLEAVLEPLMQPERPTARELAATAKRSA